MSEDVDWTLSRRIPLKQTTRESLERIVEVLSRGPEPDYGFGDDDKTGDREPRKPIIPPQAGAIAVEAERE